MESFSSKIKNRIRMFVLFNTALEILARAIRQECNKKKNPDWKGKKKLFVCMCAKLLPTLCDPMDEVHQASLSMVSLGKNTGVGCYTLLQGIFSTQGSNPNFFFFFLI